MDNQIKCLTINQLTKAAECLRILAHPYRLRIIQLLLLREHAVGEIAEACGINSNVATDHLKVMQAAGMVLGHKEGRRVLYRLEEPHLAEIMKCVEGKFLEE
jgi:DNA-binding transcriptional ArsR family regulator